MLADALMIWKGGEGRKVEKLKVQKQHRLKILPHSKLFYYNRLSESTLSRMDFIGQSCAREAIMLYDYLIRAAAAEQRQSGL